MNRTLLISAINVVMPVPHSPARYIGLFADAFSLRASVNLRNDFQGLLGSYRLESDDRGNQFIQGEVYKFFDLRLDAHWFNVNAQKLADPKELNEVNIPNHLKPHFKSFAYIFYPKQHKIFFVVRDRQDAISARQMEKFLTGLFRQSALVSKYGQINIHIEPAQETLANIYAIPRLRRLHLEVLPPNPDDLEAAERELFSMMTTQRAGKLTQTLEASDPMVGLVPSQHTKNLASIAQSNGHVDGSGLDLAGKPVKVSTREHPLVERVSYNSNTQSSFDALQLKSKLMLKGLLRRSGGENGPL